MDHVSTWLQAALLPDRWNVAGVSCGALSVWHVFVLQQTANPYYIGTPTDRDAATALLMYCSQDYASGKRMFSAAFHRARTRHKVTRVIQRQEWPVIDADVTAYIESCTRTPGHKQPVAMPGERSSARRSAASPLCWVLVDFLSRGSPEKIEAAWNTPYSVARCMFDARRDIQGDDETLETADEEIRFDEYQKRAKEASCQR